MRPPAASSRGNVALVELCGDGIEARGAGLLYLSDDRQQPAANRLAFAFSAAVPRFAASSSLGLPRRVPRALAAFKAALVRSEIISRSCCATAARICTVSLFACGLSTATNSTPD